jgi:hypothetical protein
MPQAVPALTSAVRNARRWLLWLALVIGAAHSAATWHAYTHAPTEPVQMSRHGHAGPDSCLLCVAAAGITGADTTPPPWHLGTATQTAPAPLPDAGRQPWLATQPYAIRAPPLLVS